MLPLLKGTDPFHYPRDNVCPVCNSSLKNGKGIAYISAGALLMDKQRMNSIDSDRLEAFFSIGFHGSKMDMSDSANMLIVDDLVGGQFDLQFYSIRCLRNWLKGLLDQLESQLC